ncbi:ATP-binding protein [Periweissella cryptocerci]|nr:AAA family ATPase [Periweissella cryptocerci]
MKIKHVKIYGFGKWSNQEFDFNQQLQVIYGLNEAGKSTLLQFIVGMLFGFAANKGKHVNTYEPQSKAEYGGELIFVDNDLEYRLTRVGRTATVTKMYYTKSNLEVPNPEAKMADILAPLTRETFQQVYSFGQIDLNEIVELNPSELTERLLRIGAAGSDQWLQVAQQFEKTAKNKFAAGSKAGKRPINEAINAYHALETKLNAASATLPAYQALTKQISNITEQLGAYSAGTKSKQKRLLELQTLQRVAPIYREWRQLNAEVKQSSPAVEISDAVQNKIAQLQVQVNSARADINRIAHGERDATVQSPELSGYLQNKVAMDQLELNLPRYEQVGGSYQRLTNESRLVQNQMAQLASQIALNPVPQPMTGAELQTIQNNRPRTKMDAIAPVLAVVIGLLLTVLTPGFGKLVGGTFVVAGIVFGIYKFKESQASNDVSQPIGKYFAEKSAAEIYALQPLLIEYANQVQKVANLQTQINQIQEIAQSAVNDLKLIDQFTMQASSIDSLAIDVLRARQFFQLINQQRNGESMASAKVELNLSNQDEMRQRYQELQTALQTIYLSLNIESDEAYQAQLTLQVEQQQRLARITLLADQLTPQQMQQLEHLKDELPEQVILAEQAVNDAENMQQSYLAQLADLKAHQQQMAADGTYIQVQQQIANAQTDLLRQLDNYYVEALAAQWINKALAKASNERLPQILALATNYFKILTLSGYNEIRFVGDEIKLVAADGAVFTVEQLSKGTSEQLYVALRFAFAIVLQDIVELPLLIDDGFVNFDYQRRQQVLELLQQLGQSHQVLYFTADTTVQDTVSAEILIKL